MFQPPLQHELGLMDGSLPYGWPAMAGAAPSSPSSSMSWSQSIPGYLSLATPDACPSGPPSIGYDGVPAHQMRASIEPGSGFLPAYTSNPSSSPEDGGYMSTRSSFSSCASASGFVSPAEPAEVSMSTGNGALLLGAPSTWHLDRMGQANLQGSMTPYQGTTSTTTMREVSPLMNVDGSSLRPRRHTHEREIPDGYSPALPTLESERRVGRAGSLQRTVMTGAGLGGQRRRRQLTKPAEANHRCEICNKYFERRYNYRAHQATHDPERVYAHTCQVERCDRKFVRKTDLARHHQSVSFFFFFFRKNLRPDRTKWC